MNNHDLGLYSDAVYNAALERAARIASTWHNGNPVEVEICDLIAKAILDARKGKGYGT